MPNFIGLLDAVPPGHWVAFSRDESRVLATDAELATVIEVAGQSGEEDPLYYFNPDERDGHILY